MTMMKEQLLVLLLTVGVFTHSATGQHNNTGDMKDKCKHEDKDFNVGDTVHFIEDDCIMLVCRKSNEIVHEKPLGQHSRMCCVCRNRLYSKVSQTCKSFKETGRCPVPCKEGGKELAHGDVLEINPAKCSRSRCLNGKIILEQSCGKSVTGCCLENNGKMVAPGTVVSNGGCVPETCTNGIWVPNTSTIINTCAKCKAYNDPHFTDFSGARFDWHIGCNHALVQEGTSINPEFGVFMDFNRRGAIGYIGGPTTYQEDRHTQVVLHPKSTEVTVNGHTQQITSSSPTLLVGPGGAKTTVMAWKHGRCIRLYGKPKILVELCGNSITIWAAKWSLGQKLLAGLCGSTDKNSLDERKLVDRQGNKHPNPGGHKLAAAAFGNGWQAAKQTKAGCPVGGGPVAGGPAAGRSGLRSKAAQQNKSGCQAAGRVALREIVEKLDAREAQAEKKRKLCADLSKSPYMPQCLEVFKGAGLTGADRDMLLNACLYDCCIVANDQEAGITVEDMLQQHHEIAAETKDQEDNTIEFVSTETKCSAEWSPVGRQCFQVHQFSESISIDDARQNCINQGATLAQPRDINATNNFLQGALLTLPRKFKGVAKEWLIDGGEICRKPEGYICEREPLACGDEDDECAWRAADGECKGNRVYMFNFCKASCKVPCDCDQPDTCTLVGGMCQLLSASCDAESNPTLCSGVNCTCCHVPDPCQDVQDNDCQAYAEQGYCESRAVFIMEPMRKYCSLTCGFCEPMY